MRVTALAARHIESGQRLASDPGARDGRSRSQHRSVRVTAEAARHTEFGAGTEVPAPHANAATFPRASIGGPDAGGRDGHFVYRRS